MLQAIFLGFLLSMFIEYAVYWVRTDYLPRSAGVWDWIPIQTI